MNPSHSFPDAEARENPPENLLRIDRAGNAAKRSAGAPEILRCKLRIQEALREMILQAPRAILQRLPVSRLRQHRAVAGRDPLPCQHCNPRDERAETDA